MKVLSSGLVVVKTENCGELVCLIPAHANSFLLHVNLPF